MSIAHKSGVAWHPSDPMATLTETETQAPQFTHARAYLLGTGATGALIAAAVIAFISLATYVAVNGMPFGGNGTSAGNATVAVQAGGTPASAAALRAAPGAVAARPVPGAPIGAGGAGAFARGHAGPGGGSGGFNGGGGNLPDGGPTPPGGAPGPGGGPAPGPGPGGGPPPPGGTPGTPGSSPGVATNTLNHVDDTVGTNLSGSPAGDVGGTVDKTVTGTVNQVGGAAGKPGLGDDVNNTGNGTVDKTVGGAGGVLGGGK